MTTTDMKQNKNKSKLMKQLEMKSPYPQPEYEVLYLLHPLKTMVMTQL